jgi:Tol biopolymer transport system component
VNSPEDRLDSWKEIAAYLKRDVTTVQRWEKREGMPVHRHLHDKMGSVYAFRKDLDQWARSRNLRVAGDEVQGPELEPAPKVRDAMVGRWVAVWPLAAIGAVLAVSATIWLLQRADYFWKSPVADARFLQVTDFDGTEQAAAVSRDGKLVAFLSDREGRTDVWVTQVGTGQFYNLTRGSKQDLVNPSVRTIGFSPDGAFVTYWAREQDGPSAGGINIWAVPTLGGQPRPYLEGAAEFDWSRDGSRLVYHTPGPGDPMFVREPGQSREGRQIFVALSGLHGHFPLWSMDDSFIYFVQGSVPDAMDIWRLRPTGGAPEQITHHASRVSHPVFLNPRTLMYLASDPDGSGPWLYSVDLDRRMPHRLSSSIEKYTSLAASAHGERLVMTLANPKPTLWRLPLADTPAETSTASRISLTTGSGFSPRLGPGYLLYVSSKGESDSIWKLQDGRSTEVWSRPGARVIQGPALAPDGGRIAFSIRQNGRTSLYVMTADGTDAGIVADSLELQGAPAWAPDGRSITSAAIDDGVPRLFSVSLDGRPPVALVREHSVDPVWAPDGRFVVYSGADIGTTFPVKAVTADAKAYPLPDITLTRGARHLRFLPGRRALVMLRGEIQHKNLWSIDLETGSERQLTNLPPDFNVRDFDISPDGREIVLERVQENSDIVLLDVRGAE